MKKQNGFTLIEFMIVVAIIAIVAAIAIPNLISARLNANETSAILTLRVVSSAQLQFQAGTKCDVNKNNVGEYGVFRELSGAWAVRNQPDGNNVSGKLLSPPMLSGAFRTMNTGGEVARSGYLFKIFLPTADGGAGGELDNNAFSGIVDSKLAEGTWCCYAWPVNYSTSGNRTFFVNQTGDITTCDNSAYSGLGAITVSTAGAAFKHGGSIGSITGTVAIGTRGRGSNVWKQVN